MRGRRGGISGEGLAKKGWPKGLGSGRQAECGGQWPVGGGWKGVGG